MNDMELRARPLFVDIVKNFFDNHWAKNYKEPVKKQLKSLQDIGIIWVLRFIFT